MTKSAIEARIVRAKNARQKRKIQKAAPKVYENTKQTVFIKGGNVSQNITNLMHDLNRLKQEQCWADFLLYSAILPNFEHLKSQTVSCTRRRILCVHLKMFRLLSFSHKSATLHFLPLGVTIRNDQTIWSLVECLTISYLTWSSLALQITRKWRK